MREEIKSLLSPYCSFMQVIKINKRYPVDPELKQKQPIVKIIYVHILMANKIYIKYLIHGNTIVCFLPFPLFLYCSWCFLSCFVLFFLPEVPQYQLWHCFDTSKNGRTLENVKVDGFMTPSRLKY